MSCIELSIDKKNKYLLPATDKEPATNPPRSDELLAGALVIAEVTWLAKAVALTLLEVYWRVELTPVLPLNMLLTKIAIGGLELKAELI